MGDKKVRVLIAEDHGTMREGMRLLLGQEPDMEVVGLAAVGSEAVRLSRELKPDVVLMDISMSGMDGLEATRRLRESHPEVKVLALTRHADYGFMAEMLRAGAKGYVLKQSSSDDLIRAVRAVAAGRSYLDPAVTGKVVSAYTEKRLAEPKEMVSEREEEVLRLIARGHSNKEIAARLSVSVKTVEAHKANVMRKLGLGGRSDIVDYAIFRGWMKNS
ncbi:MAG: response regulator transcription factor [Acidobacteria bacterium]|nr:response regulator transcription factor [Acidobacteriota bacterium]